MSVRSPRSEEQMSWYNKEGAQPADHVCLRSTCRGFRHDVIVRHMWLVWAYVVGGRAGEAVRLGEGLDGGSKGNSTSKGRDGDMRRACMWQEVPVCPPALEVRGPPAGMLVLSLTSTSLSTSVSLICQMGLKISPFGRQMNVRSLCSCWSVSFSRAGAMNQVLSFMSSVYHRINAE